MEKTGQRVVKYSAHAVRIVHVLLTRMGERHISDKFMGHISVFLVIQTVN